MERTNQNSLYYNSTSELTKDIWEGKTMKLKRWTLKLLAYFFIRFVEVRKTRVIRGISLTVNPFDLGGKYYLGNAPYKELSDPFYKLIQEHHNPDLVIDIGANYGFISLVCAEAFPNAQVIAIEPDKRLCKYIERNAKANNHHIHVINAICDTETGTEKQFALNMLNSQDNRVHKPGRFFRKTRVQTVSLDKILSTHRFVFIKSDTQGYESRVIKGGLEYLLGHDNWLIKMEFAPYCLESQNTDPMAFLHNLMRDFDIIENITFPYKQSDISFAHKLEYEDINPFMYYVQSRDNNRLGWVDLLIKSKNK